MCQIRKKLQELHINFLVVFIHLLFIFNSYEFFLDCMLLTGTAEIDDYLLDKIFMLATRNKQVKIDDPTRLERVST